MPLNLRLPYNILFWLLPGAAILSSCTSRVCGCESPAYGYFDIYYKSRGNPDLLNPQKGIYNPAGVKINEIVKQQSGGLSPIPAIANNNTWPYPYVVNNGIHEGIYFVTYNCSIIRYQNDLTMTLIQLKPGVTDTLTFTYPKAGNAYPDQLFYNRILIWSTGDSRELTIVK